MSESWVKETMELIEDWHIEKATIEIEIEEFREDIEELEKKIAGGEALIQAYRDKHVTTILPAEDIQPGYFSNKSYPEMLIDIAQKTGGYLKVMDALEIMLRAKVSDNKRAMQANSYSALGRMKKRFIKVKPGEYRYTNHVQPQKSRSGGLRQTIKDLKEKSPQMTKKEVLNYLIRTGFDFKGKKAINAVNITWAYLGYSKEGKQQSLPGVSS